MAAHNIENYFKQQSQNIIFKWEIVVMCCQKYCCIFKGIILNIQIEKEIAKLQIILIFKCQNHQVDSTALCLSLRTHKIKCCLLKILPEKCCKKSMKIYLVKMARWREMTLSVMNRNLNFETQPRTITKQKINHIGGYKI